MNLNREAKNLLSLVAAIFFFGGAAWLVTQLPEEEPPPRVEPQPKPEPEPEPIPIYTVHWSDNISHVEQAEVVLSKKLPVAMRPLIKDQSMLFRRVMGFEPEDNPQPIIDEYIQSLRDAFPAPEKGGGISGGGPYYIPVSRNTNPQMVDDFRYIVKNARLDEIDFIASNLQFKLESWEERLKHGPKGGNAYFGSISADESFLAAMPEYIDRWRDLDKQIEQIKRENPTQTKAREMWTEFEQEHLPSINSYIEQHEIKRWVVEDGVIEAEVPRRRSYLYLGLTVAGRQLYFPLHHNLTPVDLQMWVKEKKRE